MSNEELIALSKRHTPEPDTDGWCALCEEPWPCLVSHLAAALEAAQPRRVATIEEADALPVGSIIRGNATYELYPSGIAGCSSGWVEMGVDDGGFGSSTLDALGGLPATVVFTPE